jgi:uncharacterized HAD superfamily protein
LPSIYVDLDDVIAKTTCHYVDVLKHEFGRTVDFEAITSFNLQESFSLSDSEYEHFFSLVHEPEIILGLEPIDGAVNILNKWVEQGYEISVVTGRLTSTYDSSLQWLRENEVPFDSFIMVDKYSRPVVDRNIAISLERFSEMEFIIAIEDSIDMVNFINRKMKSPVILFDRPWNRNGFLKSDIRRYKTWEEIGRLNLDVI